MLRGNDDGEGVAPPSTESLISPGAPGRQRLAHLTVGRMFDFHR
jgi:hypothetical protein